MDENDFDFDDYLEMSEAERDRLWVSLCNQHNEMIDRMSRQQKYEFYRHRRLQLAIDQRKLCNTFPELFRPRLRDTQKRLLALRIEYQSGGQVGHS